MRPAVHRRLLANIEYHERVSEHHRQTAKAFRAPPEYEEGDEVEQSESRSLVPVDEDVHQQKTSTAEEHAQHNDRMADFHAEVAKQLRDILPKPVQEAPPPPIRRTTESAFVGNRR